MLRSRFAALFIVSVVILSFLLLFMVSMLTVRYFAFGGLLRFGGALRLPLCISYAMLSKRGLVRYGLVLLLMGQRRHFSRSRQRSLQINRFVTHVQPPL